LFEKYFERNVDMSNRKCYTFIKCKEASGLLIGRRGTICVQKIQDDKIKLVICKKNLAYQRINEIMKS